MTFDSISVSPSISKSIPIANFRCSSFPRSVDLSASVIGVTFQFIINTKCRYRVVLTLWCLTNYIEKASTLWLILSFVDVSPQLDWFAFANSKQLNQERLIYQSPTSPSPTSPWSPQSSSSSPSLPFSSSGWSLSIKGNPSKIASRRKPDDDNFIKNDQNGFSSIIVSLNLFQLTARWHKGHKSNIQYF